MLFSEPDFFSDQDPFARAQGVLCWADLGFAPLRPSGTTTQSPQDLCVSQLKGACQSNSPIALTLQMEKLRPRKEMDVSGVT